MPVTGMRLFYRQLVKTVRTDYFVPMTRAALLDAAIREFGEKGLEGASTRCIAAAAGTTMSAITYHYGGKHGLYLAVARHIARGMHETLVLSYAADEVDDARKTIHAILGRFADKMLGKQFEAWSLFIMREQLRPGEAFACFYDDAINQAISRLAALIQQATGATPDAARLTAALLLGQVAALRSSRAILLRIFDRTTMDEECATRVRRRVADNTDAILDHLKRKTIGAPDGSNPGILWSLP